MIRSERLKNEISAGIFNVSIQTVELKIKKKKPYTFLHEKCDISG